MTESATYELNGNVAVITLNRPDVYNAQDAEILERLDGYWTKAAEDENVHVILLKANGKNFSAGHDVNPEKTRTVVKENDYPNKGVMNQYLWEQKNYFEPARRWRNISKPSIAVVQGACVGAGLMLCWPCDLIIAADNAWFSDPTIIMGIAGVEYHGHTWELGPRKAKQLLFTADRITAEEAHRLGMVNEVVPLDELQEFSMGMANRIAEKNLFSLMMAKRVVNQAVDCMGQPAALQAGFDLHQMQHTQCLVLSEAETSVLTQDVKKLRENNAK